MAQDLGTTFIVKLLKVSSNSSVMMIYPLIACTNYFKFLLIKVISLLNLTASCSKHMSTASGFFFSSIVLLITAGTLAINYSIMWIVLDVSLIFAYWGYKSIIFSSAYLAILNRYAVWALLFIPNNYGLSS